MKFSEKLQVLRKENKLSQEALADMLDISRQSVSKWESGQTYPEMDKLLTMCKIFKCSLDDLTNDEIKDIKDSNKQKINATNFIYEGLDILKRSFAMFRTMKFTDYIRLGFGLLILILVILFLKLPFNYISDLASNIFSNFGFRAGNILSSFTHFILMISYLLISFVLFVYVYKIKYLDEYNYQVDNLVKTAEVINEETNNQPTIVKESVFVKTKKEHSFVFFGFLSKVIMFFIKGITVFICLPFIILFLALAMALVISLLIIFKGVTYFGVIIGTIFALLFVFLLIKLFVYFIFNKAISVKNMFILFMISLLGLGMAGGIFTYEIANTKFLPNDFSDLKIKTKTKEYTMKKGLFILPNDYISNVSYIEDNTMNNKIKITYSYYEKFNEIEIYDDTNVINYSSYDGNQKDILNLILKDLAKKQVRNYNLLSRIEIKIYASSKIITELQQNYQDHYEEELRQSQAEQINYYINQITSLEDEIYELNTKLDNEILKKEELQSQKEDLLNQLETYKDRIKELAQE